MYVFARSRRCVLFASLGGAGCMLKGHERRLPPPLLLPLLLLPPATTITLLLATAKDIGVAVGPRKEPS